MQTSKHILSKAGILVAFDIGKKITASDIKKLNSTTKTDGLNDIEYQKKLKELIIKETEDSTNDNIIPGLLISDVLSEIEEKKKLMELTYLASLLSEKIKGKTLDSYYRCYIINAIVSILELTESDFNSFHEKFLKFKNGKSEDNF